MNSLAFVQLLKSRLKATDLAIITADDRNDIAQAINSALVEWHALVPKGQKNLHGDATLHAPRSITCAVTSGSKVISATPPLTAADVGKSIFIEGDGTTNRVVSAELLRHDFIGTTGTRTATLHGDGFPLPTGFEHVIGKPMLQLQDGTAVALGIPSQPFDVNSVYNYYVRDFSRLGVQQPLYHEIITERTLEGHAPTAIMRVYPFPSDAWRIEYEYSGRPAQWSILDLIDARTLELPDYHWTLLLPIVAEHLLGTGLLKDNLESNPKLLMDRGALARQQLEALTPSHTQTPATVGTRPGY